MSVRIESDKRVNIKGIVGVLSCLLLVLPLVLTGCFARAIPDNGNATTPGKTNAPEQVVLMPLTARESYDLSLAVAKSWKTDAVLVSATATIPWPSKTLADGKTTWAFYFMSPSSSLEAGSYVVAVTDGKAEGIRQSKLTSQGRPINLGQWMVDSPPALNTFLNNGGKSFLDKQKKADVNIRLVALTSGEDPVWIISAFAEGSQPFLVQVGAVRGEVKGG